MNKKQIRAAFRTAVFERDDYCCAMCSKPGVDRQKGISDGKLVPLDAHHITDRNEMPNGGYVVENGITVCDECHALAEVYHQTGVAHPGYSPDDLYAKIGSSREEAEKASDS